MIRSSWACRFRDSLRGRIITPSSEIRSSSDHSSELVDDLHLNTSNKNRVEEDDENDAVENIEELYNQLKSDSKFWETKGFFTTSVTPSASLRNSARIASLLIWSLWAFLLSIGTWRLMSVTKSPIPLDGIRQLQKSIQRIERYPTTFRPLDTIQDIINISDGSGVILISLCDDHSSFVPSVASSLTPFSNFLTPALFTSAVPISTILNNTTGLPDRLCDPHRAISSSLPSNDEIFSLLKDIWSNLNSTSSYFILFHPTPKSITSSSVFVSDLPLALVLSPSAADAIDAARIVTSAWFDGDNEGGSTDIPEEKALLHPKYVWQFLLVSDGPSKVSWNFEKDVEQRLLSPFLTKFQKLADVEVTSHVVLHGDFQSLSAPGHRTLTGAPLELTTSELSGFQSLAYGWLSAPVLSRPSNFPPSILNFAVFLPTSEYGTLRFRTDEGKVRKSFSIPKWGALVAPEYDHLSKINSRTYHPTPRQLESAVSSLILHWRELLHLPAIDISSHLDPIQLDPNCAIRTRRSQTSIHKVPKSEPNPHMLSSSRILLDKSSCSDPSSSACSLDLTVDGVVAKGSPESVGTAVFDVLFLMPIENGISEWEMRKVGRRALWQFLSEGSVALSALVDVLNGQSDLAIEPHLSERTTEALDNFNIALGYISNTSSSNTSLWVALDHARWGLQIAKECLHDPTTINDTYFSLEFKAALYLPLALPFLMPLFMAFGKEFNIFRKHRLSVAEKS